MATEQDRSPQIKKNAEETSAEAMLESIDVDIKRLIEERTILLEQLKRCEAELKLKRAKSNLIERFMQDLKDLPDPQKAKLLQSTGAESQHSSASQSIVAQWHIPARPLLSPKSDADIAMAVRRAFNPRPAGELTSSTDLRDLKTRLYQIPGAQEVLSTTIEHDFPECGLSVVLESTGLFSTTPRVPVTVEEFERLEIYKGTWLRYGEVISHPDSTEKCQEKLRSFWYGQSGFHINELFPAYHLPEEGLVSFRLLKWLYGKLTPLEYLFRKGLMKDTPRDFYIRAMHRVYRREPTTLLSLKSLTASLASESKPRYFDPIFEQVVKVTLEFLGENPQVSRPGELGNSTGTKRRYGE